LSLLCLLLSLLQYRNDGQVVTCRKLVTKNQLSCGGDNDDDDDDDGLRNKSQTTSTYDVDTTDFVFGTIILQKSKKVFLFFLYCEINIMLWLTKTVNAPEKGR
jgi:hypothetical protein